MNTDGKLWEEITWLFELTQKREDAPVTCLGMKLQEELGEFSEAVLKEIGFLEHKEVKESPMREAADIINVLIGCLAKLYPERSPHELTEELYNAICDKGEKYERILNRHD